MSAVWHSKGEHPLVRKDLVCCGLRGACFGDISTAPAAPPYSTGERRIRCALIQESGFTEHLQSWLNCSELEKASPIILFIASMIRVKCIKTCKCFWNSQVGKATQCFTIYIYIYIYIQIWHSYLMAYTSQIAQVLSINNQKTSKIHQYEAVLWELFSTPEDDGSNSTYGWNDRPVRTSKQQWGHRGIYGKYTFYPIQLVERSTRRTFSDMKVKR